MKHQFIAASIALALTTPGIHAEPPGEPARTASILSSEGRHREAIEILREASAAAPGNENIRHMLASELVFDGKSGEARRIFMGLTESNDPWMAGRAEESIRKIDAIVAREEEARRPSMTAADLRRQKEYLLRKARLERRQGAWDLSAAGRDEEALAQIEALERGGEADLPLVIEKAGILDRLGRTDEAIECLRGVPGEGVHSSTARMKLAELLSRGGRKSEAYEVWRDVRDGAGDSISARRAAAEIDALSPALNPERMAWGELDLFGTWLSRWGIGVASGRLRQGTWVPGARWIEPFVQADFSIDSTNNEGGAGSEGLATIYNENLAGFHAGVRIRPFAERSLTLYAMGGLQKDIRGTEQHDGGWFTELIAGANAFHAWGPGREWQVEELEAAAPGGLEPLENSAPATAWSAAPWTPARLCLDWFVEAGGDGAYYTRLPNFLLYLQSRQGLRLVRFGKAAAIDAYAFQNLTLDGRGNYYDNTVEVGPGIRMVTSPVRAAILSAGVDYVGGAYLGRNRDDTRGDLPAAYQDFRVTVSLSIRW